MRNRKITTNKSIRNKRKSTTSHFSRIPPRPKPGKPSNGDIGKKNK